MYDSVLVPVDGSDCARRALDHALDLAETTDATLHLLYVVDVEMSPVSEEVPESRIEGLLEEAREETVEPAAERARERGVKVEASVVRGIPHEAIREYADEHDVDLVLIGTHGRTGIERHLLGSTTERVVRTTDRPVLTVG